MREKSAGGNSEKRVSIRLSPERKRELKQWLAKHDISQQQFVEDAVAAALSKTKLPQNANEKSVTTVAELAYTSPIPEWREWLTFTDEILHWKNQTVLYGLMSNILAFLATLDADGAEDESEQFSRENFAILLDRARSIYQKLKLRRTTSAKTPRTSPVGTKKGSSD